MSRLACSRCLRPAGHCLCPLIPALASRTRVLILQHPAESRHALNTGRLAALALSPAELRVGTIFDPRDWSVPGRQAYLLFPGPQAHVLGEGPAPRPERCTLVVPDATWRHARALLHANPALAALPRLALRADGPGAYRVRHAREPGALATVEAIAQALQALEAPARFDAMLRPFHALVEAQIAAMGPERYARDHERRDGSRARRQAGRGQARGESGGRKTNPPETDRFAGDLPAGLAMSDPP